MRLTNNTKTKEFEMRNPQHQIAVTSKYNNSAFISYFEQEFGRNCVKVVDRNPLQFKTHRENLSRVWSEFCAVHSIGLPAPEAIQELLMFGCTGNKPATSGLI